MKTYSKRPAPWERPEGVACPVCGSRAVRPLWDLGECAFAQCAGCGHAYQNPRPRPSDLASRYDEEYLAYEINNAEPYLRLMLLGLADLGFDGIEASLPAGRSFLDIGCATGALVELTLLRGWDAEGVEICVPAADYGRRVRGVRIHAGTLLDAAYPDGRFDFVHSSHLLEHVPEPGDLLKEIHRILKPGGYCAAVTPNRAGLQARLFGLDWRSAIADHMHLFTKASLVRMLRDRGLEPLRAVTWGGIAEGLAPRPVKAALDRAAKAFGFGDVVAVLAQKPSGRRGKG
ncbi:MAG TPA: class I SAM-dependent methyltransferase [Magnetospirillaceae bacterium]|nr:class I SAM-dependent methyltransferase [Magnetospirillaceae bacterium]